VASDLSSISELHSGGIGYKIPIVELTCPKRARARTSRRHRSAVISAVLRKISDDDKVQQSGPLFGSAGPQHCGYLRCCSASALHSAPPGGTCSPASRRQRWPRVAESSSSAVAPLKTWGRGADTGGWSSVTVGWDSQPGSGRCPRFWWLMRRCLQHLQHGGSLTSVPPYVRLRSRRSWLRST
jgi:hypothetical protein